MRNFVVVLTCLAFSGLLPATGRAAASGQSQAAPAPSPAATQAPAPAAAAQSQPKSTKGSFWEHLQKEMFTIKRIPKKDAVLLPGNRLKPRVNIHVIYQIVGEEGDDYLVRNLPPEDPDSVLHAAWARHEGNQARGLLSKEYYAGRYIINTAPDSEPPFTDLLDFTPMSKGLPSSGRWQISFDVADVNGDGRPDLVLPPQRQGAPTPLVFLGQKDGSWLLWQQARWPDRAKVSMDYGAVRVADFDGDGHADLVVASHFKPTYVLYGDGQGDFRRAVRMPQVNGATTFKAVTVADFNHDGRPDIALLAELDIQMGTAQKISNGLVQLDLNLEKGWEVAPVEAAPAGVQGESINAADLDGDGYPDLLLSSRGQGVTDLVLRNRGAEGGFEVVAPEAMPANGFIFALAGIRLAPATLPDVVATFEQFNPLERQDPAQACVLFRFHDAAGKLLPEPHRTTLFKETKPYENYQALAVGDIDGDGRDDIAVATNFGRVRVFLQLSNGSFYEERSPELQLPTASVSSLRIADVDGDGRGELFAIGAPRSGNEGGGVFVFTPLKKSAPGL